MEEAMRPCHDCPARHTLALALGLAAGLACRGAGPSARVDPAEVAKLVANLGSEDAAERAAAMKRLKVIGYPALGALRKAAKADSDPDVRLRAQLLISSIEKPVEVPAVLTRELAIKAHTRLTCLALRKDGRVAAS